MTKRKRIRNRQFADQNGRCFYCQQPMWLDNCPDFARRYALSERAARNLQATAEHLHERCNGGGDTESNIVAACHFCNQHRHRYRPDAAPPPDEYRAHVQKRLQKGAWHRIRLCNGHALHSNPSG